MIPGESQCHYLQFARYRNTYTLWQYLHYEMWWMSTCGWILAGKMWWKCLNWEILQQMLSSWSASVLSNEKLFWSTNSCWKLETFWEVVLLAKCNVNSFCNRFTSASAQDVLWNAHNRFELQSDFHGVKCSLQYVSFLKKVWKLVS